jgi:SmpA / OmlA family
MGECADTHERDDLPSMKGSALMPPIVSALALGAGLTLAGLGLVVLLMLLTMNPRATPTLIWWGRLWNLRTMVLALGIASALFLMVPRADWSAGPPRDREADDTSHGPRDEEASSHRPGPSAPVAPPVVRVPGTLDPSNSPVTFSAPGEPAVAMTPPAGRAREAVRPASPPEPLDLTGEWTILNTVVETSYPAFQQLQVGFHLTIQHEGQVFHGVGEKQRENGQPIPRSARRPLRIQGMVVEGGVISATFQEEGWSRPSTGHFRLRLQDRSRLTGTFVSTAAKAKGSSQWIRTSAPVAHASRRDQPDHDGRIGPPPGLRPSAEPPEAGTTPGVRVARQSGDRTASRTDGARELAHRLAPVDQHPTRQHRSRLRLGMTQDEVRALLGEPTSVEAVAGVVFWHYGTEAHEQDVVFEQETGRVHGWLGFARGSTDGQAE